MVIWEGTQMGKGDKKSKKGKINRGSYGKTRRPANRPKKERLVPQAAVPKPAPEPPAEQK